MNSIKNLQKAAEYEIMRQKEVLENGGSIIQETRSFDPDSGKTYSMRLKETMNDYRYFPEPDLTPIVISDEKLKEVKDKMPKLPNQLFETFTKELGILDEHAFILIEDKSYSDYFLEASQYSLNNKSISNWIVSNIKGYLNENNIGITEFPVKPKKLAELIMAVDNGEISNSAAQTLMNLLIIKPNENILSLALSNNLIQQKDENALENWISEVILENNDKVIEYKKGKKGLIGMFVGEVMKKSKGAADPKIVNKILSEKLN